MSMKLTTNDFIQVTLKITSPWVAVATSSKYFLSFSITERERVLIVSLQLGGKPSRRPSTESYSRQLAIVLAKTAQQHSAFPVKGCQWSRSRVTHPKNDG